MPVSTKLIDISFICYSSTNFDERKAVFIFYPSGRCDDDKLTIQEAVKKYPPERYNWINVP